MTDQQIILSVQTGGAAREMALHHFYHRAGLRESVIRVITDRGGNVQDAQDVFQEAFVFFDRNLREGRFEGRSTLSTYLTAIAKWHWMNRQRKSLRLATATVTSEIPDTPDEGTPEATVIDGEQRQMLEKALSQIGERCRQLLTFYQMDYSMSEIATSMGYQGAEVAKKEAYRCRMKLRERLMKSGYG